MNRTRMLLVGCSALILSVAVTFVVYRLLRRQLNPLDETISIVVAAEKLPLGSRITEAHLRTIEWPKSAPLSGSFTQIKDLVGRGVIVAMQPNEPVLDSKLAPVEAGAGLTTAIPEGMRAVGVKVNDVIGVAGFVVPGTRVDVILTGSASEQRGDMDTSKVILEGIQVLAAGQNVEQDVDGKPQNVQVITLLVTPEDSQKLAFASLDGKIQLALRNPLDFERANPPALKKSALYNGPSSAPVLPATVIRRPAPKQEPPAPLPVAVVTPVAAPQKLAVELIQGTKQQTLTFDVDAQTEQPVEPQTQPQP